MGQLFGREYGFLYSVGAEQEIARLCPGEDLKRMREILAGTTAETIGAGVEMLCILSRWHEKARALEEGAGYEPKPLTSEELLLLPKVRFKELQGEALQAVLRDNGRTVEAEPAKKDEAPRSS